MKRKICKKEYILLTFNSSTIINYDYLGKLFNYTPTKILANNEDTITVGWKQPLIKQIIDDIINNSNTELISVSEDEKNIRYHFIKYSD